MSSKPGVTAFNLNGAQALTRDLAGQKTVTHLGTKSAKETWTPKSGDELLAEARAARATSNRLEPQDIRALREPRVISRIELADKADLARLGLGTK